VKLPFRRSGKSQGSHVAHGYVSHAGDGLADRLRELGVPVHDPIRHAYDAGRFGVTSSGSGGLPPRDLVAAEMPKGSTVTKAPSVVEKMAREGFVWNGSEGESGEVT
jgi:hypothetical protein